jgi:hypothetical protein
VALSTILSLTWHAPGPCSLQLGLRRLGPALPSMEAVAPIRHCAAATPGTSSGDSISAACTTKECGGRPRSRPPIGDFHTANPFDGLHATGLSPSQRLAPACGTVGCAVQGSLRHARAARKPRVERDWGDRRHPRTGRSPRLVCLWCSAGGWPRRPMERGPRANECAGRARRPTSPPDWASLAGPGRGRFRGPWCAGERAFANAREYAWPRPRRRAYLRAVPCWP